MVEELRNRVEDWKGHDVKHFGPLVLEDTFAVIKNDSERDYHVYLFEKIILCCKEVGPGAGGSISSVGSGAGGSISGASGRSEKKNSKSNSMLRKPTNARKKTTLQLKGRIFITNVLGATHQPRSTASCPSFFLACG